MISSFFTVCVRSLLSYRTSPDRPPTCPCSPVDRGVYGLRVLKTGRYEYVLVALTVPLLKYPY
eukprot:scaffold349590_cov14-Prasinocladus_malaysianus.AAC.1